MKSAQESDCDKRILSINQAAKYAGVSRGIFDDWIRKGFIYYEELPGRGKGYRRFIRIRRDDLDAFLDERRKRNTHQTAPGRPGSMTLRPRY